MGIEITRKMTFGELLQEYPAAGRVLASKGLHCIGCHIAVSESIEDGAMAHGLSDKDIDDMVEEVKRTVAV
jgi:hybrid cluster-associated redox disulfide protein